MSNILDQTLARYPPPLVKYQTIFSFFEGFPNYFSRSDRGKESKNYKYE